MSKVSVIVPTYNRLGRLKQVLAALERQTVPLDQFEVVVVCDGATDGTDAFLRELKTPLQLNAVIQPNGGPASARNNGVAHATGELVLFVDDDVVAAPELIEEHLRVHAESANDRVVLGPMLTPRNFRMLPWVRWEQDRLYEQYDAMQRGDWAPTARQFYTGNSSVPRVHIVEAGGFDERFRRAEDVELAYRLADRGLEFVFNADAIGYHYAERSFRSWMATPYDYGRNDVVFAREKGQEWLADVAAHEFQGRHRLIRFLVRCCVGRALPTTLTLGALRLAAQASNALGLERLSQGAYSGLFNLRYYQGFADELGGREQFMTRFFPRTDHDNGSQALAAAQEPPPAHGAYRRVDLDAGDRSSGGKV